MNIEHIAQIVHEAHRIYCISIGDTSQSHWEDCPQWQRDSAVAGVRFWIDNDGPTPEQLHANWYKDKVTAGWVYGPVKDAEAKTHPCLVAYEALPSVQRTKDVIFGSIVRAIYTNIALDE